MQRLRAVHTSYITILDSVSDAHFNINICMLFVFALALTCDYTVTCIKLAQGKLTKFFLPRRYKFCDTKHVYASTWKKSTTQVKDEKLKNCSMSYIMFVFFFVLVKERWKHQTFEIEIAYLGIQVSFRCQFLRSA